MFNNKIKEEEERPELPKTTTSEGVPRDTIDAR